MVFLLKRACLYGFCYNVVMKIGNGRGMGMLKKYLMVGIGGALGSLLRFGINVFVQIPVFPLATLSVNLIGTFTLGVLTGYFSKKNRPVPLLLGTGLCGGFTTMSTFTAESVRLLETSVWLSSFYISTTLILGIIFGLFGISIYLKG